MGKFYISILILGFIVGGCSFGEYADEKKDETITNKVNFADGKTHYEFTSDRLQNKTLYKVTKTKSTWSMISYDFNKTHFNANQIIDGNTNFSGTYSIDDTGHLKLIQNKITTWIKATKEDNEKIFLLWTSKEDDLNKTIPSKDTYFFKSKTKADKFIK